MNPSVPHESAIGHVTGESVYVDDMSVSERLLHGRVVYSPHAKANIKTFDLVEAKKTCGIHAVLCYQDIPGQNQVGPIVHDEPCLAVNEVHCIGQAVFLIAGETESACLEAEKKIKIEYEILEPVLDIQTAITKNSLMGPERKIERGDVESAMKKSPNRIRGSVRSGAQEHWYLETHACLCVPGEQKEMMVYSSTQHPSETQAIVSEVLGLPRHEVVVEIRRMGGAFGGKETQANHIAAWTALLSHATKRPVKIRLFRDDDQKITGKRHRYLSSYEAGFNQDGTINAVTIDLNADGGCATDLSFAILERAMLHSDNAYYLPNIRITGKVWKTNLPSNTAFRGFGGPQGMAVIEIVLDRIARYLKKEPADIRFNNFYGLSDRNTTPYGETVENNRLYVMFERLMKSSNYTKRKKEIDAFNTNNEFFKKGIYLTPVKFGISFTTSFLNQAGALVNIYADGSVLVNHGGTEMGQGLNTKIQQIAAKELGVSVDRVKVNPTNTSKIPNTSATAASSGSDLNGMAVRNAVAILKSRIAPEIAKWFSEKYPSVVSDPEDIVFANDKISDVKHQERAISFAEAMSIMVFRQVSLSGQGFYRTPNIYFDRDKGQGRPFHYFAFGMAVTEVQIDTLTGRTEILRTDILHDAGDSINPALDRGQVEGGYIQGCGWVTTEEIKWDAKGNLMTHSPDTYKIPSVQDIPADFRVELLDKAANPHTIHGSKAVGEPPFMLALSCWLAIKDAVTAAAGNHAEPELNIPATSEAVLMAIQTAKKK